ncbi:hypothetical protein LA983_001033 [Vibrio fluvialis]|nr:hypothetical protein [Vibrio fluvialis]
MRNLPIPNINCKQKLTSIINSKSKPYKGRLVRVRSSVKRRYDEYDVHSSRLESIPASGFSGVYVEALTKCYTSKTKELSELRDDLLYPDIEDFDECPFCGIGEPTTLDHYLPKEEFPEYSVFSKNLIPICSACNSNYKGTKWKEGSNRIFLHTYFDIIPDERFFKASITVGDKLSIDFSTVSVTSQVYFSNLFSKHFEKLSLNKRYKRKAASEIKRKRRSLERIYRRYEDAQDVSNALRREASSLEVDYSKNHWKPVLYRALSDSQEFCDAGFRKQVVK